MDILFHLLAYLPIPIPFTTVYHRKCRETVRLPNYRVRMGFGLHSGWAIEVHTESEMMMMINTSEKSLKTSLGELSNTNCIQSSPDC